MNLPNAFNKYRDAIDSELKTVLGQRNSPMYDMMRYHLGWIDENGNLLPGSSGKALRPVLCLLACEASGGDYEKALPAAATLELVHNYSLIHDDIQDGDKERRHRPTVWSIWGKPQAINAGTAMRILANIALWRLKDEGVPTAKQLRAQQMIDESCLALIEGQYLDISYESRLDISVNDYLDMVGKKTGALLSCSMELGALLGTEDEETIAGFKKAGMDLGLAFQIRDDILGIWGDEQQTGKPSCSDIRRKKKSFPIIQALATAKGENREYLLKYYSNGVSSASQTAEILNIMEDTGSRTVAEKVANRLETEAGKTIDRFKLFPSPKQDLDELLKFLAERSY